jgi:hypothetical protein
MSEATVSSTEPVMVYVPLLNEGTDVLRPTTGIVLGPNVVQVLATPDYNPAVEEWEFPPGTRVSCVTEVRGGQEVLVARHRVK